MLRGIDYPCLGFSIYTFGFLSAYLKCVVFKADPGFWPVLESYLNLSKYEFVYYRILYGLFFLWLHEIWFFLVEQTKPYRSVALVFNSALVLLIEKVFSIRFPAKDALLLKDFRYRGSMLRMTLTKVKLFWILSRTIYDAQLFS